MSLPIGDEYENVGCWMDTDSRALEILAWTIDPPDVIPKCFRLAKNRGYKTFALQWGVQCFGGANDTAHKKYGPSANCQENGRGGDWGYQVYRIKEGKAKLVSS